MPAPSGRQIKGSVFRGLGLKSGITMAQVTYIDFEPTVGILAGKIDSLGAELDNFRVPLERAIEEVILPSIDQNFESGGRPKWQPWSSATPEIMQRMGEAGGKLMERTGSLRDALQNVYSNWKITDDFAIMDHMPFWYGALMQSGYEGKGGGKKIEKVAKKDVRAKLEQIVDNAIDGGSGDRSVSAIPARPFVMLQDEDEDAITEIFLDWLGDQISRYWVGEGV